MSHPVPSHSTSPHSAHKVYALLGKKHIENTPFSLHCSFPCTENIGDLNEADSHKKKEKLLEVLPGCVSKSGNTTSKGSHILLVIKVTPHHGKSNGWREFSAS